MDSQPILLGVIGRPHGVRGHVHVISYTVPPENLTAYGTLTDAQGRRYALRWIGGDVAELSEITSSGQLRVADRGAGERLTNTRLFVDRAALPPPDEDEFYLTDLIGLTAIAPDGAELGRVAVLHDYGAGASLEIEASTPPTSTPIIVPFTRACVPEVDLAARRLTVCLPDERIASDSAP